MHLRKLARKVLSSSLAVAIVFSLFGSLAFASPGTGISIEPQPTGEPPAVRDASAAEFDTLTPSESKVIIPLTEGSHAVTVEAKYKDGSTQDVTTQGAWTSLNPEIATVAGGVITAAAAGSTEVRLNLGDAIVNIPVTVTSGDESGAADESGAEAPTIVAFLLSSLNVFVEEDTNYPLHLRGTFSDGATRDITASAEWSSDSPEVATVTNGMIKGVKAGESTFIKVKYGSLPALSIAVTVQKDPIPLQNFGLLLSEDKVKLLESDAPHKMYADLEYPDQDRYEVTTLGKWSSQDESVATVDANGVITPVGKGMTYIYFTYKYTAPSGQEGEEGYDDGLLVTTVQVFVGGPVKLERYTPGLQEVDLSAEFKLPPRSYQEFTIQGVYSEDPRTGQNYDADDITGEIEWTIEDKSIATITDYGRIYAGVREGTTKVTGTYLSFVVEFNVTVTKEAETKSLLNLVAEPPFVEITDGRPVRTPAVKAIYSNGSVEDVTSLIAKEDWLASDPTVAYRNDEGNIVAESVGSSVIGAGYQGEIAIIPVIVKQADSRTAASITVTPATFSLQLGDHEPLSVEAVMSDGAKLDKTLSSSYRSDRPDVVSVNRSGEMLAVGPGTANIEVVYGGQRQSVAVEVEPSAEPPAELPEEWTKQLTGVTASESSVTLDVYGGAHAITVQAAYNDGTSADVTAEGKWTSQDPSVVTVKDGVLTPVSAGSTRVHLALEGAVVLIRVTVNDGEFSSNVRMGGGSAPNGEPAIDVLLLSATQVLVEKGDKYPIKLMAVKSDGTAEDVSDQAEWSIYDPEIAEIVREDGGGVSIHGKSTGTANPGNGEPKYGRTTLTVSYGGFQPTIIGVSVAEKPDERDIVEMAFRDPDFQWLFDDSQIRLYKGQTPYPLLPFALDTVGQTFPAEGGEWHIGRPDVARVNSDGALEAVGVGETDVVYTYVHYEVEYRITLHLQVVDLQRVEADAEWTDNGYSVNIHPQGSSVIRLKEVFNDSSGETRSEDIAGFIDWQVENPDIVAIGYEQPHVYLYAGSAQGTTKVTGEYFGKRIEFEVTVTKNPIKPKIMTLIADPTHYRFDGAEDQPVAPVIKAIYSDATVVTLDNAEMDWGSDNPSIADLTEDGKIARTYRKGGTIVYAAYKGSPVKVPVIVTYSDAAPLVTGLNLTDLKSLAKGKKKQLRATATLSDLSEEDVTGLAYFQSLNPEVAEISGDGLVTGVKTGTAKIKVYYNGFVERLNVTVTPQSSTGPSPGPSEPEPTPGPSEPVPTPAPAPEKPALHPSVDGAAVKENIMNAIKDPSKVAYSDVPEASWSYSAIELATKIGFVEGYPDGSFRPKTNVSRAEFASMLAKALGLGDAAPAAFTDVNRHWAQEAIGALSAYGFIGGYGDGTFRPDREITRAEIVTILAKVIDFGKAAASGPFEDIEGHWAAKDIDALAEAGVVQGRRTHTFAPNGSATREEAVALILRALNASLDLGLFE